MRRRPRGRTPSRQPELPSAVEVQATDQERGQAVLDAHPARLPHASAGDDKFSAAATRY